VIEIVNLAQFQRQLERLQAALQREADGAALETVGQSVHTALLLLATYAAEYPPAPQNSAYRRTGTLGRLWTTATPQVTVQGHVFEARISNATPYGPRVQDPEAQIAVHRGRWQTTEEVVQAHADEVDALVAQAGLTIVERVAASAT
jgi:hypothetical protein